MEGLWESTVVRQNLAVRFGGMPRGPEVALPEKCRSRARPEIHLDVNAVFRRIRSTRRVSGDPILLEDQNQAHPLVGLRNQDRLSPDEESRLHEGAVMGKDLRKKVHPASPDLVRRLPPPPSDHRYVAIGGHLSLIDNKFQVKGVIHLHDNH